jgi:hypothetical protein
MSLAEMNEVLMDEEVDDPEERANSRSNHDACSKYDHK